MAHYDNIDFRTTIRIDKELYDEWIKTLPPGVVPQKEMRKYLYEGFVKQIKTKNKSFIQTVKNILLNLRAKGI